MVWLVMEYGGKVELPCPRVLLTQKRRKKMIHVNNIYRLLETFIEARDTLADIANASKKLNNIIDKMDVIIRESHEE